MFPFSCPFGWLSSCLLCSLKHASSQAHPNSSFCPRTPAPPNAAAVQVLFLNFYVFMNHQYLLSSLCRLGISCPILKASLLTGSQNSALYFELRRLGTGDLETTLFLILYFLVSATLSLWAGCIRESSNLELGRAE